GAGQNVMRVVAKHAAVTAHLDTNRTDFMLASGVKHPGQDNQNTGDDIHRRSPCDALLAAALCRQTSLGPSALIGRISIILKELFSRRRKPIEDRHCTGRLTAVSGIAAI